MNCPCCNAELANLSPSLFHNKGDYTCEKCGISIHVRTNVPEVFIKQHDFSIEVVLYPPQIYLSVVIATKDPCDPTLFEYELPADDDTSIKTLIKIASRAFLECQEIAQKHHYDAIYREIDATLQNASIIPGRSTC